MSRKVTLLIFLLLGLSTRVCRADCHWTVADGLPTGEIQQIIELPNGQMLVNCEGAFCISDGNGFLPVPCQRNKTLRLAQYCNEGYGYMWQGDSLLWLHDFYRLYLFDARLRSFRYDIRQRLANKSVGDFVATSNFHLSSDKKTWGKVDPNLLPFQTTCVAFDHQGGCWVGTLTNGIFYHSPVNKYVSIIPDHPQLLETTCQYADSKGRQWTCRADGLLCHDNGATTIYNASNVDGLESSTINFITELPDHRFLIGCSLGTLGYFYPDRRLFVSLMPKVPRLVQYRYFVGACAVNSHQAAVYTQNGAFLLDIKTNKITGFPESEAIENHSDKYNCMLLDKYGNIYVGTQNGLFRLTPKKGNAGYSCHKVGYLANDCIRSIVADRSGNIWVGTSWGISRVTPSVINLNDDDGAPNVLMHERVAKLLADDRLAFATALGIVVFNPDSVVSIGERTEPQIIAIKVNNEYLDFAEIAKSSIRLSYTQNYVCFQFSALNYATPSHIRYRYRLSGLENKWHIASDCAKGLCQVDYNALPPGEYVFQAQAAFDGGEWGGMMQQALVVNPPLWFTWWAKLIYIFLAVSAIFYLANLYFKRRRQKLEKENDMRVNHLFELRDKARHQFAESTEIDPRRISISDEEEKLMERMLHAIDAHMGDAEFGVDQLASEIFMSRSALYAKLRTMLGITPSDFIRNVRLKHAAQLLAKTQMPVSEIALRIGYNTSKAFTLNFKRAFGVQPSEYRNLGLKDV